MYNKWNEGELFAAHELREFLNGELANLRNRVGRLQEADVVRLRVELVAELKAEFQIVPVNLDEQNKQQQTSEECDGVRVVVSIPFSGDSRLWQLRPQQWRMTPTIGAIDKRSLMISKAFTGVPDRAAAAAWFRNEMGNIRFDLEVMEKQIAEYHANVEALLPGMIAAREQKLGALQKFTDGLNLDVG